ncbi:hypothetical protein [Flavilitoribacter nigricans]|uniref:Uncharacterized protein n=1 Tax=Flavilitoribacter nigricans (strain ATCC 23147 / DSM 23189 / NBRC 102662 / NCIMB 1420 / SS-2) TaxID=1122177 RepID=A0A2D0NC09_FLAN2|nr:hypothetical protein [Flavilitoribacter nigricans]PHN06035.1 hypothetical protein CRP01_13780 [Flavilitoribacter nigricans DSM 23189 = NBRC 102662]
MPSYYIINGQRYDRQLLETAQQLTEGRGDGRISRQDAEIIWEQVQDGSSITATERRTILYLLEKLNWSDRASAWSEQLVELQEDPEEENGIDHIVRVEFDLESLRYDFPPAYIRDQEALEHNRLSFSQALRTALQVILHSDSERESPRQVIGQVFGWFPAAEPEARQKISLKLYEVLRNGQMSLLPAIDWNADTELDFNPPEGGESATDNWIFTLYLPTLSDHLYWVIVPRDGKREAFIYGFN